MSRRSIPAVSSLLLAAGAISCSEYSTAPVVSNRQPNIAVFASGVLPADTVRILVDGEVRASVSPWDRHNIVSLPLADGKHTLTLGGVPANCLPGVPPATVTIPTAESVVELHLVCHATAPMDQYRIAVAAGSGTQVYEADTLRTVASYAGAVAWSPDGRSLAAADQSGIWRLTSELVRSGGPIYSDDGAEITDLAWSPDGHQIAFSRCGPPITSAGDCTGEVRIITEGPSRWTVRSLGQDLSNPAWSPDGMELAVTGPGWGIHRFNSVTGQRVPDFSPVGQISSGYLPSYSPDGRYLAYLVALKDDPSPVRIRDLAIGSDTPVPTAWAAWVARVAWIPDGSGLILNAIGTGSPGGESPAGQLCLFVISASGEHPRPLVPCGNDIWSFSLGRRPGGKPEH